MKTANEIQDYISLNLPNKEFAINETINNWLVENEYSDIIITNPKGVKIVDIEKTEYYLSIVNVYKNILYNQYLFKESMIIRPEIKNGKTYNDFLQKKYEADILKEKQLKIDNTYFKDYILECLDKLKFKLSAEQIIDDFYGEKINMKRIFQYIFSKYGIVLNDKMLNSIFGTLKLLEYNKVKNYDKIYFFSKGTNFHSDLFGQFNTTQSGSALGIFTAFFMRAAGKLKWSSNEPLFDEEPINKSMYDNNPFYSERKVIRILATACCF